MLIEKKKKIYTLFISLLVRRLPNKKHYIQVIKTWISLTKELYLVWEDHLPVQRFLM